MEAGRGQSDKAEPLHGDAPEECQRLLQIMEPKKSFLFTALLFYVWPLELRHCPFFPERSGTSVGELARCVQGRTVGHRNMHLDSVTLLEYKTRTLTKCE